MRAYVRPAADSMAACRRMHVAVYMHRTIRQTSVLSTVMLLAPSMTCSDSHVCNSVDVPISLNNARQVVNGHGAFDLRLQFASCRTYARGGTRRTSSPSSSPQHQHQHQQLACLTSAALLRYFYCFYELRRRMIRCCRLSIPKDN